MKMIEIFDNKEIIKDMLGALAYIGGSIIGVHFAAPDNWKEGIIYFITALCCSIFIGGWIAEYYELGSKPTSAVGFVTAILGVYIVRGMIVFGTKFSKDPTSAIGELFSFFSNFKKGGNNEHNGQDQE